MSHSKSYYYSFNIFLLILLVLIIVYILIKRGKKFVVHHWNEYKCSPLIIPIAGLFGKDTAKNAKMCFFTTFKYFFSYLMKPLQYIIAIIQKLLKNLFVNLDAFREFLKPIRLFIKNAAQVFYEKLSNFTLSITFSLSKMRNILRRMSSSFRLTLYTLEAIQFSIKSLWDGPIGKVSRSWAYSIKPVKKFFCLHPDSLILRRDGKYMKISEIRIGDILYNKTKVLGIISLKVDNQLMINFHGRYLSSSHLIYDNSKNRWYRVENLPNLRKKYTGLLYCLQTDNNHIYLDRNIIIRDFEEIENWDEIYLENHLKNLNGIELNFHNLYKCSGILGTNTLYNRKVSDYNIGDMINGNKIHGILSSINNDKYDYQLGNMVYGGRQLIKYLDKVIPISYYPKAIKREVIKKKIFYSFLTESPIITIDKLNLLDLTEGMTKDEMAMNHKDILNSINFKQE